MFLFLEEGLCDQHYVDIDTNTILLNRLGFNEAEEVILDRENGIWALVGNLQP